MFRVDLLKYLADITVPDGMHVQAGGKLPNKQWAVRNGGTTQWGAGYRLVHVAGERLSSEESVPLPALTPGESGRVTLPNLTAPPLPGHYTSIWMAQTPNGECFDSPLTIEIVVVEA
jgi:hypothetical protein